MQGYGHPSGRRRLRPTVAARFLGACVGAGLALSACGLSTGTDPSRIVLPPTDELSTETEAPSTTSTTTTSREERAANLPNWTIGRIVSLAPRVENSRFHQGAVTEGSALEDTSGFHFSTPDGAAQCSTGTNGMATLACRINGDPAGSRPSDAPSNCDWAGNLVTLDSDGPEHGACANEYPVLYRSTIVDYGHTISISRFSCLVETAGMFCLESRSQSGFSVTTTGYHTIFAADRAPESLVGLSDDTSSSPSDDSTTTTTSPTR
ncbi:hypothetical protein Gbro_3405 [Gordonia bronchialis DSM 43247]|uniref:LppI n=1 Tax=Gordonia bronchialis (strain ATCC 25592 / DSM 43247 / BCRC 13721 / JCM 3198 / KCTC 3076 / NBRC 16047 / NCTC 10667) TaxID=526226 RepID=D0LE11_GORB4|nr:hypothetical protein Gbro_3405 [Gordonia bronchialis DSM 43247]STQ65542.1 Uncharacterised protein [Gordonia bronchialis]